MRIEPKMPGERGRDYALRMLRQNIVSCDLEPGSAISENELAVQLGLSRTPVREAIIELAKVNIMEVYPQRSSQVALIDYTLVDEAQFMRVVMECAVVAELATHGLPANDTAVRENLGLQEFYGASTAPEAGAALFELDNNFHKLLFEACGKQRIFSLMGGLELHFDRVRRLHLIASGETGQPTHRTVADHERIYEAVLKRDAAAARRAMEEHLTRYRLDQQLLVEKYPRYFKGNEA